MTIWPTPILHISTYVTLHVMVNQLLVPAEGARLCSRAC